ncbi:SulP family inorganic anion transporter [Candidatus Nitrospira allomarina]|uniref:SulP family inorganic anion transporter n=1 Tax=Candidatus Nitrospira allomarina TaxID=3020900 RepID=A0AA96K020_9BACT|nr:SulP family inorganic anion transporter [Candidatus Nitrospira allomarina]WNM59249.1 SulP family inorganic anion transporter [Candidatus Nitrospira allomarina]
MGLVHGLHFNNLRGDIYGGMVAAVVALPLALAFGVASGLGAIAGLYGAIFVGFFAALFGGTPAQVSGPTGPMTVVMAGIVTIFAGNPGLALMAVILGGVFQILLGLSRVGQYIALVPYPVVSGFMSGIGCIILILQLGPLVGHASSPEGVVTTLKSIPGFYGNPVWDAALAGVLVLVIMYLTPGRIAKVAPPSLLALLVVTPLAYNFLPDAPTIGEVPRGFPTPLMPTFTWDTLQIVLESAAILAVLGAIDSLLTSLVCDNMTRAQHDPDRELIGQGIGNMVAGVFGGLPGAGATMRSVANIRTGGRTPISGVLHSIILLAVLLGLGPLAEKIPLAVLGGILFKVGIDIIDWRFLRHILQAPRIDVVIMTVVLLTTVLVDLITAVAVGMVFASLFFVKRMADLELANLHIVTNPTPSTPLLPEEATILEQANGKILLIHVDGPMSFGSAKTMVRRLETVPGFNTFSSVVLDLSKVPAIDGTAALAVEDMLNIVKAHHQHLFFVGMQPHVTEALDGLGVLVQIRPGHRFASRLEALQKASLVEKAHSKEPPRPSAPNTNLPATPSE